MFRLLDRLASKHFVAILLVTICFTAFSLSLQAYIYYTQGVEARDQILQSVESSYLAPTAAAVFYFETEQLQLISEGILRLPYIDSLTIYEYVLEEYRPLLVKNADSRSNESFDFPLVYFYEGEARHIGKLTVHSSLSAVRTQIIENLRRTAVFNIFTVLGMAVIILWLTNRNITKRMKVEETLRQSNERFRIAQDMSPDGFTILQPVRDTQNRVIDFTWVYENDSIARINGTDPQKVVGKRLLELFPGHRDTQFMKVYQQVAESGKAITFEDGYSGKSMQKHVWFRIVVVPMVENIAILTQDITERMQAEAQLQKSEEQFRNLYDEAPVGYFEYDLRGDITRVNHTQIKMLGYTAEEMIGQPCWKFIVDEVAREQIMAKLDGVRPPAVGLERTYRRKDGTTFPVLFEDRLLLDEDGHIKGIRTAIQDITERKRADKEREKLQAQLNQAQKMESVGRLAGGVAHDFNNMLSVILGHTEMALEETDPASPLYADLHSVHQAAERSAALTRQLLAFARKQTVAPKVIDLNETVEGMLKMLRRLIGENIDLLWQPGGNLQPVKVDPAQIDQLLANLCVNARDAIEGVGKITIETDTKIFDEEYCTDHLGFLPGKYVLLEVSDDGCGMDKKTLNQIFEPFFTTKEQGKGTGLGLASIYGMVKQNNGFINVYSEPDQGTTFKIYLPIYAVKSDEVVEKSPGLPAEHGNETILLVEDETAILEMTTRMLERLGYTVMVAATPGEAIRLAHECRGRIDLLMTDVVMPEMNGRELAGNLLSHYPDLKRLFMSGYTANVIAHHGVLDQGVHFIQKPFSKKDLGGKLREALEG